MEGIGVERTIYSRWEGGDQKRRRRDPKVEELLVGEVEGREEPVTSNTVFGQVFGGVHLPSEVASPGRWPMARRRWQRRSGPRLENNIIGNQPGGGCSTFSLQVEEQHQQKPAWQ